MATIRKERGAPSRTREEDAIHLFTTERVFDAIANGELKDLGLDRELIVNLMVNRITALLVQKNHRRPGIGRPKRQEGKTGGA
jgi:hypothetical protein